MSAKLFSCPVTIEPSGVPACAVAESVTVQSAASIGQLELEYHSAVRLRSLPSDFAVTCNRSSAEVMVALSGSADVSNRRSAVVTGQYE